MLEKLKKARRKLRRAVFRDETTYYDMYENPGEQYFGRIYLHHIQKRLEQEKLKAPLAILDAGCQAGRFAIPLARLGHRVTGVDTSDLALRRLKAHAREAMTQVRVIRADLSRWLPRQQAASYDVVLCLEVLYLRRNHPTLLKQLIRLLRPGGLCFISHRPLAYYLAEALGHQDSTTLRTVLTSQEATLWGSYYNWQTRSELSRLYSPLEIRDLAIVPIGLSSWLSANPEHLTAPERERLLQADLATPPESELGRYLLVSGKKR